MKCETKIPPVRERETVEERKDRTKICINRHFYYFHVYLFKIKAIFISLVIHCIQATILKSVVNSLLESGRPIFKYNTEVAFAFEYCSIAEKMSFGALFQRP